MMPVSTFYCPPLPGFCERMMDTAAIEQRQLHNGILHWLCNPKFKKVLLMTFPEQIIIHSPDDKGYEFMLYGIPGGYTEDHPGVLTLEHVNATPDQINRWQVCLLPGLEMFINADFE